MMLLWFLLFLDPGIFNGVGGRGGGKGRLADTNWPKNYTFTLF